jgi:uncharacterized protein YdeI (BOF family)
MKAKSISECVAVLLLVFFNHAHGAAYEQKHCAPLDPDIDRDTTCSDVSIVDVIANPRYFHGKQIHMTGYLNVAFKSSAIYLHHEDYIWDLRSNRIKLAVPHTWLEGAECKNNTYVSIKGIFNADVAYKGFARGVLEEVVCEKARFGDFLRPLEGSTSNSP